MKSKLIILAALSGGLLPAQFGFGGIVSDPIQEGHSAQQILQEIQQLQRLDANIQLLTSELNQIQMNARYFGSKVGWAGMGNQIVRNWSPNPYGAMSAWNPMVMLGLGSPTSAWGGATVTMQTNPALAQIASAIVAGGRGYNPYAPMYADAAAVNVFDGAGPTAIQTLGNARQQQIQMNAAISQLQGSVLDGGLGTNSQVQQLNLIAGGTVQQLQMQQTMNNLLVSLLEQQTAANMITRNQLADQINTSTRIQTLTTTQPVLWGGDAASTFTSYRIQ